MRLAGKVKAPLTLTADALHEEVAKQLLSKAFQPFTGEGDGRTKPRQGLQGVEAVDFIRVLRSFSFPGTTPLKTETAAFLFELCSAAEEGGQLRNEEGRPVADANYLIELIFGNKPTRREEIARQQRAIRKEGNEVRVPEEAITGKPLRSFAQKVDAGRRIVGSGPVQLPAAVDAPNLNKSGPQASTAVVNQHLAAMAVPLRFLSRKSRTALAAPSSFDAATAIARSNSLPSYELQRRHVFGMSTIRYSGNALYVLPRGIPTAPVVTDLRSLKGPVPAAGSAVPSGRNHPDFIDPATIIYTSAALGIVHNLNNNTQSVFDNTADDITCITISPDGSMAATGCMGKSAVVSIWNTSIMHPKDVLMRIGQGFFARGVNAVQFSYDCRYLIAVGCDDYAMLGIFELKTGNKVAEMAAQHGIPPQIAWLKYCPLPLFTEWITRDHSGACDVFVTVGQRHLRFWSFLRPTVNDKGLSTAASLLYKGGSIHAGGSGNKKSAQPAAVATLTAPKAYTCCDFIPCEDKSFDLVTGGSNGQVAIWRRGVAVTAITAWRGRVQVLIVAGDKVIVGGAAGLIKVLDGRTLSSLKEIRLYGDAALPPAPKRPSSAKDVAKAFARPGSGAATLGVRPASTGRARPASANSAGIAAGRPTNSNKNGNIISGGYGDDGSGTKGGKQGDVGDGVPDLQGQGGQKMVVGLALVTGQGTFPRPGTVLPAGAYLLAALGTGKLVRVDLSASGDDASAFFGKELLHFHCGPVYGLAADSTPSARLVVTVGDDKKLMVWDSADRILIAKSHTRSTCRSVALDRTNCFIATGSTSGELTVHFLSDLLVPKQNYYRLEEVAFRKDAKGEATVLAFSPSNDKIALGSRDDCIYLYSVQLAVETAGQARQQFSVGTCVLRALHRLRGHSATITSIDWSYDSALLQSTCGAYELLCWDATQGKLHTAVNLADVRWKTHNCLLGFNVMGIWPPYSDGTDINAVDASREKGLVVTANDAAGLVRLLNYPSVVRHAPAKEYTGHSSHVTCVRFLKGADRCVSSGGNDGSLMLFDVVQEVVEQDRFR